ncbi:MAG: hypothetical protein ABL921_31990 [Pirellula sp.]
MKLDYTRLLLFAALCVCIRSALADEPSIEDGWLLTRDPATTYHTMTRELTLHPKSEPKPALKHRLLPDEFDLLDGNAAIYYLKAMGFLEQRMANEKLNDIHKQGVAEAKSKETTLDQVPPFSYQETPPNKLPIKQVKEYLALTNFQTHYLEEARKLRAFSLDRNLNHVDNPVGYLLPEVQSMRELARIQRVRCRLAIAEGRIDDAIKILGQQYAMAKHLGTDEFYVSALVGIAISGIGWTDALYLIEHDQTPNLYWAFASLPAPLVDLKRSHAFEGQFLFEQIKVLREVDETRRTVDYWQTFTDRFMKQATGLESDGINFGLTGDPKMDRVRMAAFIAAAFPGAARYLQESEEIPSEMVEAYPTAQVVFLAMKRYYERMRDDYFKWNHFPISQSIHAAKREESEHRKNKDRIGLAGVLPDTLLPALGGMRGANARVQQNIAMIQAVEAIRMYSASHDGKLPLVLSDAPVPVPNDPLTDQPFGYESNGTTGVLSGSAASHIRYRLILKTAPK